jgi:hypothetical protein
MKLISHRGNLIGPDPSTENTELQINKCIDLGFDVEIDVWVIDGNFYLGHDGPVHMTTIDFLKNDKLWCHAKNLTALDTLLNNNVHCFWHENDERTLTSKGVIWTYPEKQTTSNSVVVVFGDTLSIENKELLGVCGDYVEIWKTTHRNLF